jgi:hypothetical protein
MAIRIYLLVYFTLIGVALAALWQGGVLVHLPAAWVALSVILGFALGALLAYVSFRHPTRV